MNAAQDFGALTGGVAPPRWESGFATSRKSRFYAAAAVVAAIVLLALLVLVAMGLVTGNAARNDLGAAGFTAFAFASLHSITERISAWKQEALPEAPRDGLHCTLVVPDGWWRPFVFLRGTGRLFVRDDALFLLWRRDHHLSFLLLLFFSSMFADGEGTRLWLGLAGCLAFVTIVLADILHWNTRRTPWADVGGVVAEARRIMIPMPGPGGSKTWVLEFNRAPNRRAVELLQKHVAVEDHPDV